MLRSLVRLTTGVELGIIAVAAFIGVGFAAMVSLGMEGGSRLLVEGLVILASAGVVVHTGAGIWNRYRRLLSGRCGHPDCHGVVADRDDLPEHLVICENCRRIWPRLRNVPVEVTAG
ncbi:MAG: hypothetical protein ACLFU7_06545 [Armatimonadota bacterium]